jgi:excisionase family DNA binding protein
MVQSKRPRFFTVRDACKELACGKSKLYELIGRGAIEAKKMDSTTLVLAESIDRYIDTLPAADIRTRPRKEVRTAQAEAAHQ